MSRKNRSEKENKKDKSPYVYQEKKLDFELHLREFNWTDKQREFIKIALDKNTNYVFCQAPAGVGKTLLAVYVGLKLLQEGRIKNIYFIRNPVESSSFGLGYLSGSLENKLDPYIQPMSDHLNELLPQSEIKALINGGFIQFTVIGFLKGRTFNSSLIIGDEVEDYQVNDFRLIMGRLGKFSKMLLLGDVDQSNVKNNGFQKICDLFNSPECAENGIYYFTFLPCDIMRNKILGYIIDRFKLLR